MIVTYSVSKISILNLGRRYNRNLVELFPRGTGP